MCTVFGVQEEGFVSVFGSHFYSLLLNYSRRGLDILVPVTSYLHHPAFNFFFAFTPVLLYFQKLFTRQTNSRYEHRVIFFSHSILLLHSLLFFIIVFL